MKARQARLQSYNQQIQRLSQRIKTLEQRSDRIATWRLLVLLLGGIPALILLFSPYVMLFLGVVLITVAVFIWLIARHRRVDYSIQKHQVWLDIKQEQRARMVLDWKRIPVSDFGADATAIETDLDLRELHRLLNTASSHSGSRRLNNWISQPADIETLRLRQDRVRELTPRPTFRDKITLAVRLSPAQIRQRFNTLWLRGWFQNDTPMKALNWTLIVLVALASVSVIALIGSQIGLISPAMASLIWGAYVLAYISRAGLLMTLAEDSVQIYDMLLRLRAILRLLENHDYRTMPTVQALVRPLQSARPSTQIRDLMVTIAASNLRGNPPLWLFLNAILPWDLIFLRQLHRQKQVLAHVLPQWLDIWHELEALNSLANFAYLNPSSIMPDITTEADTTLIDAQDIGHPLIPAERRVSNNFTMQSAGEVVILTGSNMSGKSSFLRTLGVNLVMAYAGGPVLATSFEARLMRIFSCIRVTDSLDDGISYFYAEVKRLKALLDALQSPHDLPLFFLIDEIFKGTNNRERLIGSRSYIQALIGTNGAGLIATHDLELTALADGQALVRNMHFREHLADGRMVFDYILRDGASPTTNALHIMALEGLPVELKSNDHPDGMRPSQPL